MSDIHGVKTGSAHPANAPAAGAVAAAAGAGAAAGGLSGSDGHAYNGSAVPATAGYSGEGAQKTSVPALQPRSRSCLELPTRRSPAACTAAHVCPSQQRVWARGCVRELHWKPEEARARCS